MCSGVDLARKPHNRPVLAAYLGPVADLARIDIGNLLEGQPADRVGRVDGNSNGISGDNKLDRGKPVRFGLLNLNGLHLARCIGNVGGLIEQGSNARARASAGDRNADVRMLGLVLLRPSQRQVDNGIGAFVLDV